MSNVSNPWGLSVIVKKSNGEYDSPHHRHAAFPSIKLFLPKIADFHLRKLAMPLIYAGKHEPTEGMPGDLEKDTRRNANQLRRLRKLSRRVGENRLGIFGIKGNGRRAAGKADRVFARKTCGDDGRTAEDI